MFNVLKETGQLPLSPDHNKLLVVELVAPTFAKRKVMTITRGGNILDRPNVIYIWIWLGLVDNLGKHYSKNMDHTSGIPRRPSQSIVCYLMQSLTYSCLVEVIKT
jgi:hypothetical protein